MRKMDDWELSSEEFDSLERDALKQLAERNCSSAAATTSHSNSNRPSASSLPANVPSSRSPAKPTFLLRPSLESDKVTFFSLPSIYSCFLFCSYASILEAVSFMVKELAKQSILS